MSGIHLMRRATLTFPDIQTSRGLIKDVAEQKPEIPNIRDHLANERTYLAWIRTSIGIMAFGFVIEKFALFLKNLQYFIRDSTSPEISSPPGYSTIIGIILVVMGALMGMLSFIRYKKVEQEINEGTYNPSLLLDILVALGLLIVGIFLIFYMIHNI